MNLRKHLVAQVLTLALTLMVTTSACSAAEVPESSEDIPASPTIQADTGFPDVSADADYAQAVAWCREQGLMQGTSATEFSPDATLTRAMVVTVLYRAEQEPYVEWKDTFSDVSAGQWYSDAITWANAHST